MAELLKSSPAVEIDRVLGQVATQCVRLIDRDALRLYLARHAAAADILLPAVAIARSRLGESPRLSLEIYRDPEFGGEQLSLYARSDHYSVPFLEALQAAAAE